MNFHLVKSYFYLVFICSIYGHLQYHFQMEEALENKTLWLFDWMGKRCVQINHCNSAPKFRELLLILQDILHLWGKSKVMRIPDYVVLLPLALITMGLSTNDISSQLLNNTDPLTSITIHHLFTWPPHWSPLVTTLPPRKVISLMGNLYHKLAELCDKRWFGFQIEHLLMARFFRIQCQNQYLCLL